MQHTTRRGMARWIAGAVLALGMAGTGTAALGADLKLGANIGNVPWEFQDKSGAYVGFEIDLVTEAAKRMGMGVQVVNIPFTGLFAAVQSGQIDAAVSSITITKKRLASVSFAQPYYDSDQSLSARADGGIAGLDSLSGKAVGVDTGSTGDVWATQHQAQYKIGDIRRYEGLAPAMLDLAAGRIDAYLSDAPAVQYYIKDKPVYKLVARIPTGEQYSVMFAKDSPLADTMNMQIDALKKEGFVAGLHEKWFGAKADANSTTVKPAPRPTL